MQFLLEHY